MTYRFQVPHWLIANATSRFPLRWVIVMLSPICLSAPFRNLDFQSPNVSRLTFTEGLVRDIIPGWQLQVGGQDQKFMYYNDTAIAFAGATLRGPRMPVRGDPFTFTMHSGELYVPPISISIYQTGDLPIATRSLLFKAAFFPSFEELHVSMNGQQLLLREFERDGDYFVYGSDVSEWAGKSVELRFTAGPSAPPFGAGGALADIHFSSAALPAIPEPSTWALLITGLAALAWNHHPRGRRQALNAGDFRPPDSLQPGLLMPLGR